MVMLFWSQGCEASLLALRSLAELADAWTEGGGDGLTVLAVHTPRFPYEDALTTVEMAVERHNITVPVLHDPDYVTWNRYNPGGWPATVVIDKRGRVAGMEAGVANIDTVAEVVADELARPHRPRGGDGGETGDRNSANGTGAETENDTITVDSPPADATTLDTRPNHNANRDADSTLSYPSGVAVTPAGRLVVADTGNNRLLVGTIDPDLRTLRPEVEITDLIRPTAVACCGESIIYVVESGTDSVLQIDLDHGTLDLLVDRLGGDVQAPTGLLVDNDGSVVVADAGRQQLLRVAGGPDGDVIVGTVAGSGADGTVDGKASHAALAQPVGLARTSAGIAFCDAASSNVRLLTDGGRVLTVTGNDFFDFGLVDGPAHRARLQRPSGLCALPSGDVVIADTGNNRLRMLSDRRVTTLGLAGLDQPAAVAALPSGELVVADTGNNRLVVADSARRTGWPLAVYPAAMTSVWEPAEDETSDRT